MRRSKTAKTYDMLQAEADSAPKNTNDFESGLNVLASSQRRPPEAREYSPKRLPWRCWLGIAPPRALYMTRRTPQTLKVHGPIKEDTSWEVAPTEQVLNLQGS